MANFDGEAVSDLASAVREGGRVASTLRAADSQKLATRGLTGTNIQAMPTRDTLSKLVDEVERGNLQIDVERTLPFDQAPSGLDALANGGARGKIVVTFG